MNDPNPATALTSLVLPLGCDLEILFEIYAAPPQEPEPTAKDWVDDIDHARVQLLVFLPSGEEDDQQLDPQLRLHVEVAGTRLDTGFWGGRASRGFRPWCYRTIVLSAPTQREAVDRAIETAREIAEPLRDHLTTREARLLLRAERLARIGDYSPA